MKRVISRVTGKPIIGFWDFADAPRMVDSDCGVWLEEEIIEVDEDDAKAPLKFAPVYRWEDK